MGSGTAEQDFALWLKTILLPGTPVNKASILPEDRIEKIDDKSTMGMSLASEH
jgi:C-terminal processing protease CtpA/Prc